MANERPKETGIEKRVRPKYFAIQGVPRRRLTSQSLLGRLETPFHRERRSANLALVLLVATQVIFESAPPAKTPNVVVCTSYDVHWSRYVQQESVPTDQACIESLETSTGRVFESYHRAPAPYGVIPPSLSTHSMYNVIFV